MNFTSRFSIYDKVWPVVWQRERCSACGSTHNALLEPAPRGEIYAVRIERRGPTDFVEYDLGAERGWFMESLVFATEFEARVFCAKRNAKGKK